MRQLREKHGGLDRVHPKIAADPRVVVARGLAVQPQVAQELRRRAVVRRDGTGVSRAPQVLRGIEGEGAHPPHRPRGPLPVGRADRLARVFDHGQLMTCGDFQNRAHVGALPVQMNRFNCLGAPGDRGLEAVRDPC